jgi:hypothetical protein
MKLPMQQYLEAMESLIASDGWRLLTEDFKKEIDEAKANVLDAPNWDTVLRIQGRVDKLTELTYLEDFVRSERANYDASL